MRLKHLIIVVCLSIWATLCSTAHGQINTDRVLNIGRNALYFEDYVLSIQYFNEVIAVKPYLAEPYLYRSIAKVYLDDYMGAEQDATECIERNPFLVTAYHVRGMARQNLKDYDGARADFMAGLEQQPQNKTFLRGLAVTYALQHDYTHAAEAFDRVIELFPNDPTAHMQRAQLRMEQGDTLGAIDDLDRTIAIDKGTAHAYGMRALIRAQQEQWTEAQADLDLAIRLDPEQTAYYVNRGMVRYNLNDLRGALDDYDRAVETDPRSVIALYNRGLLRAQLGDRSRAIADFSAVIGLEPENTLAIYNRALLRDETGDIRGAIADYTSVYNQHPNFFPAVYARAEDYRKMGQTKVADEDYRLAFTVEQRVKRETQERQHRREQLEREGVQNADSVLLAEYGAASAEADDDGDKMRRESDRNIRKFNRIMASDADQSDRRYSSPVRGRIQDRQSTVEMQPLFVLTYYEKSDEVRRGIYFEKTLSDFNRAGLLSRRLKVVCQEPMLTEAQVQVHFASIDDYSKLIGISGGTIITLFGRSLDFMLVQDYQSAIQDLSQILLRKDNFILAYFNRAVMRFRLLEVGALTAEDKTSGAGPASASPGATSSTSGLDGDADLRSSVLGQSLPSSGQNPLGIAPGVVSNAEQQRIRQERQQQARRVECELCMRDLDKVIELSPSFVYAYYNRAFISAKLGNFEAALHDLDHAIELYPDFAEAYYNRGLVRLRLGQTQSGLTDLSKAGELGISQAYSVLKRASSDD